MLTKASHFTSPCMEKASGVAYLTATVNIMFVKLLPKFALHKNHNIILMLWLENAYWNAYWFTGPLCGVPLITGGFTSQIARNQDFW